MEFLTVQNLKMLSAGRMRLIEPLKTEEGAINFNFQTCIFILQRFGFKISSPIFYTILGHFTTLYFGLYLNLFAMSLLKVAFKCGIGKHKIKTIGGFS